MLTQAESISDFKAVTAAQKAQLEQQDAAWERPPQSFIDMWNNACGTFGRYNEQSGYFELNGLTDIGYDEAVEIYNHKQSVPYITPPSCTARTNLLMNAILTGDALAEFCQYGFSSPSIEVARVSSNEQRPISLATNGSNSWGMFCGSTKLRKILGAIILPATNPNGIYHTAAASSFRSLEEVKFKGLKAHFSLIAPNITMESVAYLIDNATNTTAITVTLHNGAYDRLTEELIAKAAAKDITFAKP